MLGSSGSNVCLMGVKESDTVQFSCVAFRLTILFSRRIVSVLLAVFFFNCSSSFFPTMFSEQHSVLGIVTSFTEYPTPCIHIWVFFLVIRNLCLQLI